MADMAANASYIDSGYPETQSYMGTLRMGALE